jgi:hypothetical protein
MNISVGINTVQEGGGAISSTEAVSAKLLPIISLPSVAHAPCQLSSLDNVLSSSSSSQLPGQRLFFISYYFLLRFLAANAAFHSHSLPSLLSHRFPVCPVFQHPAVRAIQRHFLGHPAKSPPPCSYRCPLCFVSCATLDPPAKPRMEFRDEHGSRNHLSALPGWDDLRSLPR